jgi:hypothetical protein
VQGDEAALDRARIVKYRLAQALRVVGFGRVFFGIGRVEEVLMSATMTDQPAHLLIQRDTAVDARVDGTVERVAKELGTVC